tara:strand:+ start:117 stop:335 length:219 start_codon:yes stop_codon:yes gene_type:complete
MRETIVQALRDYYLGQIAKSKANIEIFLTNNAGVGDHPDVIETIDKLVGEIAQYDDKLRSIDTHFNTTAPRI